MGFKVDQSSVYCLDFGGFRVLLVYLGSGFRVVANWLADRGIKGLVFRVQGIRFRVSGVPTVAS